MIDLKEREIGSSVQHFSRDRCSFCSPARNAFKPGKAWSTVVAYSTWRQTRLSGAKGPRPVTLLQNDSLKNFSSSVVRIFPRTKRFQVGKSLEYGSRYLYPAPNAFERDEETATGHHTTNVDIPSLPHELLLSRETAWSTEVVPLPRTKRVRAA